MTDCYLDGVSCIAFDFCGTLAELRPSSEEILGDWLRAVCVNGIGAAAMSAALQRVGVDMPYSSLVVRSERDRHEYFVRFNARVLALLGCDEGGGEALYYHFRRQERHWTLRPGAEVMLRELGTRGYRLALASNFDPTLVQLLSRNGIADLFGALFISGALGFEKPDLAFYKHVCNVIDRPAGAIAMVGDDLTLDVYPAISIGMKAIHLRPDLDGLAGARFLPADGYMEICTLDDLLETFLPVGAGER